MTDLNEMWAELAKYQPYADKHGFGEAWLRMCEERTDKAALDASSAAAWDAAWAAAAARDAAEAAARAQRAIDRICKAIEQEQT